MSPTIVMLVDRELTRVRNRIRATLNDLQTIADPHGRLVMLRELELLVDTANDLASVAEEYGR